MMTKNPNRYQPISTFGSIKQQNDNDVLTYLMTYTTDSSYLNPPNGAVYSPFNRNSQEYMSSRCSKAWDPFCEYYYQNNNQTIDPNGNWYPAIGPAYDCNMGNGQTVPSVSAGKGLLGNSLFKRFCTVPSCNQHCEPFDPTVAGSPMVCWNTGCADGGDCVPVCMVDPKTIDNDPLMNKALMDPAPCMGVITNICNNAANMGIDLSGTKIGRVCNTLKLMQGNGLSKKVMGCG